MNTEILKIEALLKTISRIHSSLNIEDVLENSLKEIIKLVKAEAGSLWEVDREKGELFFRALMGKAAPRIKNKKLKLGEGFAGTVALTKKPLIIKDVKNDKRWKADFDRESFFTTYNLFSFPLLSKGEAIGVIQLLNKKKGFEKEDFELMSLISGPISIALENAKLYSKIKKIFKETALSLALAIEKRDPYTGGHTKRVFHYSKLIGEKIGLKGEELEELELSAILHDIGKIGIPDSILRKKEPLTEEERKIIEKHPVVGAEIVMGIDGMEKIVKGIKYHHEKWNGTGYPEGLKGEEIPLFARIISIADVLDALTTERPYKKAIGKEEAISYLLKRKGKEFWKDGVDALNEISNAGIF